MTKLIDDYTQEEAIRLLKAIANKFSIGENARSGMVILTNIDNMKRWYEDRDHQRIAEYMREMGHNAHANGFHDHGSAIHDAIDRMVDNHILLIDTDEEDWEDD